MEYGGSAKGVAGAAGNPSGRHPCQTVQTPQHRGDIMRHPRLFVLTISLATAAPLAAQVRTPEARIYSSDAREEHRAALGVSTSTSGSLRDTIGLLITGITRGGPAEKAGLEEGNRIAAINGVSLRAAAGDVEDWEASGTLTHRLTRELGKVKPGDEVELRVYRDGRTTSTKVKTVDADSLFGRREFIRVSRSDRDDRPALGFGLGSTGSRRDTLGVLVMSVPDSTPAARAGLEEGNRIAAINGVNLRVAPEDAGDAWLASAKANRLQREIQALKPGDDVTLRVYANGQFRDVHMKVARAGDLPRRANRMMFLGDMMGPMPPVPPIPPMPAIAPLFRGDHRMDFEELEPQFERLRVELPRLMDRARMAITRAVQTEM
jgi:S1-C subfamily serine protease